MSTKPSPLSPGDVVAIVAPSGPIDRDRLELGVAFLESRGFVPRWDPGLLDRWRYLAGPDDRRRSELHDALLDPDVRCVWAARGGYGAMRLLSDLPLSTIPSPRWLVGFSDVTALHCAWLAQGLGGAVHGPNVTTLGSLGGTDRDQIFGLVSGSLPPPALGVESLRVVVPGEAEGPLVGGNLSLVTRLLGTPYAPASLLSGSILVLEDVGERPYRLDRMLAHIRLSGARPSAVVLGDFVGCEEAAASYACTDVLEEVLAGWGVPVVAGFPAGHGPRCRALPLGVKARVAEGRLEVRESPWSA